MQPAELNNPLPINRMRALRESRRISLPIAAEATSLTIDQLKKIEDGEAKPTTKTLKQLADLYSVPGSSFFTPGTDDLSPPLTDYRTVENRQISFTGPLVKAISFADEIARFMKFITIMLGADAAISTPQLPGSRPATATAKELERLLQYGPNFRALHLKPNQLIKYFRKSLGDQGISVLFDSFKDEHCRGFCFVDEFRYPTIVINTRNQGTYQARLFTLIHEACHIFLRQEGIVDPYSTNGLERYCNQVVAEFLAPQSEFVNFVQRQLATQEPSNAVLKRIAGHFNLSQQAAAIRLEDLSLVDKGYYRDWLKQFENRPTPDEIKLGGGKERPDEGVIKLAKYGHIFVLLAHEAIKKGVITEFDVHAVSRLKPVYFKQTVAAAEAFVREVSDYAQQ